MIIHSSGQVSRCRFLRRFPLPRGFGVLRESRIEPGRHWPAPAGAKRTKSFQIYRARGLSTNRCIFQNMRPRSGS